jgi:hypothetical protein
LSLLFLLIMLSKLPQTKTGNIIVQSLENELLIYDLITNKVYCLNETSALVYQACDGKTDFIDFKNKHHFPDEIIFLALDSLKKENLLAEGFVSPLKGMKRREIIKKIALASVIALPVIATTPAPTAAQANSCGGTEAPGAFVGCAQTELMCINFGGPQCQSCSAMSIIAVGPGACPANAPYFCTCN